MDANPEKLATTRVAMARVSDECARVAETLTLAGEPRQTGRAMVALGDAMREAGQAWLALGE